MWLRSAAYHRATGYRLAAGVLLTTVLMACRSPADIAIRPATGDRWADCRGSDPAEKVEGFYQMIISDRVRGLPSIEAMNRYAPMLSQNMRQAIEQARVRQRVQIAAHPDEKPSFIEGDLFTSMFEGPTAVESARVVKLGDPVKIEVSFVHDDKHHSRPSRWNDIAVLRCEQGRWRVDDVHYGGKWDFASKGSLVNALVGGYQ